MKGVIVFGLFVSIVLGAWVCVILINGMRRRIETVNRRREERKKRANGQW